MPFRLLLLCLLLGYTNCLAWQSDLKNAYDYSEFYKAFKTEDTILFNQQLKALASLQGIERDAFYGALLMKKSKSLPTIKMKLDNFRDGRELLENSIQQDPSNPEFRFLRLATQENAPSILNYNDHKEEDASFIIASFAKIAPKIQHFIREYATVSEVLKPEDLN